jgi:predicted Zn-dependent protease
MASPPPSSAPNTYLHTCLKSGRLVRWPEATMPIAVYLAPFHWYEPAKKARAAEYMAMAWESFQVWAEASQGKVRFKQVARLQDSQINLEWRRVTRQFLGVCQYNWDAQSRLYSADISIGLTDGLLHKGYNSMVEVRNTIIHEVGHALGLIDHSDDANDMMYYQARYGQLTGLSPRDVESFQWLYRLPVGFNFVRQGEALGLKAPFTMNQVLQALQEQQAVGGGEGAAAFKEALKTKAAGPATLAPKPQALDLTSQQDVLSRMGQFYLATSTLQCGLVGVPSQQRDTFPPQVAGTGSTAPPRQLPAPAKKPPPSFKYQQ